MSPTPDPDARNFPFIFEKITEQRLDLNKPGDFNTVLDRIQEYVRGTKNKKEMHPLFRAIYREVILDFKSRSAPPLLGAIPEPCMTRYEGVVALCRSFCDAYPELPIRDGVTELISVLARRNREPAILSQDLPGVWAAGLILATCQAAGIGWKGSGKGGTRAEDVSDFFRQSKTVTSQKALAIKKEIWHLKQIMGDGATEHNMSSVFSPDWALKFASWATI